MLREVRAVRVLQEKSQAQNEATVKQQQAAIKELIENSKKLMLHIGCLVKKMNIVATKLPNTSK